MPLGLYYEWRAYAGLNPFGQARHDWNAAMVASVLHNTLVSLHVKNPRRYQREIADLMFKARRSQRRKSPKEMYNLVRTWALAINDNARRPGRAD